jgi:hypothetical protein
MPHSSIQWNTLLNGGSANVDFANAIVKMLLLHQNNINASCCNAAEAIDL